MRDLLVEYVKGINALTIDRANTLQKQGIELQEKLKEAATVAMLKDTIACLSDQLVIVMEEFKKMKDSKR